MRMGKEEEGEVFCVCRSSDQSRFMIGCDQCEEWYHGDCINISASKSKSIKKFFCPPCQEVNPSLEIQYHTKKVKKTSHPESGVKVEEGEGEEEEGMEEGGTVKRRCGQCIGCFRSDDCGRCDGCKRGTREGCRLRQCVNAALLKKEAAKKSGVGPKRKAGRPPRSAPPKVKNASVGRGRKSGQAGGTAKGKGPTGGLSGTRSSTKALEEFMKEAGVLPAEEQMDEDRQCEGPQCCNASRAKSKYCSEECGMAMARSRMKLILPQRLAEWHKHPVMADLRQRDQLEAIRTKREKARERLTALDFEEKKLSAWMAGIAGQKANGDEEGEEEEEWDDTQTIFCATCGSDIPARTGVKHQMKCFSKYESQASYGSPFKVPNNPYKIFCEVYNKVNQTYCRRLRVICPEHSKETRPGDEICGYPLHWKDLNIFPDISAGKIEFLNNSTPDQGSPNLGGMRGCRLEKKKCLKHHQWDRLRKASIDQERLTELLKLDDLFEEERSVRVAMASRGGLLALLLHSTTDHSDPETPAKSILPPSIPPETTS